MKNPNCPTTCRYHMPHVVVYVVPYAAPACWRPHRCCTPIANVPLAYLSTSRKSRPPNHKTIPRIVKPGPFIVSLARPRSSDSLNRRRELCPSRTAAPLLAAWWEGRARRDAVRCRSLSLVRIPCCPLVPPDLCGFPDGSPQRDEGKARGKSVSAFAGGRSRGRVPTRRRKCTQVGRGARRARPVMWRHIEMFWLVENGCPALP